MIARIIELARARWETWLDEPAPGVIAHTCIKGGGAHPSRGMVMLFGHGASRPRVILKIALSDREAGFLKREFDNLSGLHVAAQPVLAEGIPKPLGWEHLSNAHIMAIGAVRGRRILHPHLPSGSSIIAKRTLDAFFRGTFEWSRELTRVPVEAGAGSGTTLANVVHRFARNFLGDFGQLDRVLSFADHLDRDQEVSWVRGWQHGATDITNALTWRGDVRFVDWEHASSEADPWFDVAYAPLATGRMGVRQLPERPARDVCSEVLDSDGWVGKRLRSAMEDAWSFPIPLSTAVVLSAMEAALRRERPTRPWAADLAIWLLTDDSLRNELRWLAPTW